MPNRSELLSWLDVEHLIDHLVPQFDREFDAMILITRGGIIPGGMLAEVLNIEDVLTAAVDFPFESQRKASKLLAWPKFIQFPDDRRVVDQQILVVDDVWGSGRTITAVRSRITSVGGFPKTCVMHYNPYRNLFTQAEPDYYAAITDAHIIYPWEIDRGSDGVILDQP